MSNYKEDVPNALPSNGTFRTLSAYEWAGLHVAPPTRASTYVQPTSAKVREQSMLTKKELEDLRPWVAMQVTAVLGGLNPKLVDDALDCIGKSFSRQSTTG